MCCSGLLKIIMFIFNGIIFVAGAAILGLGIWVAVDSSSLLGFLDHIEGAPPELAQLANVGYLLIGVGGVLVLMGFLGCCGAVRESRCMLLTFFIIVLIIFLAEVAGAVVILVFQPVFNKLLEDIGEKVVQSIGTSYGEDQGFTDLWNSTMDQLNCCGYYNYTDFSGSPFVTDYKAYPVQCCSAGDSWCSVDSAKLSDVEGCFPRLVRLLEDNAGIVGGVALGICAIEIAAMIVSMTLYKKAK
ncbi:tetraspanin 34a [Denticeps clupeoides]|uniref:Tetraspanin n=1 Tax=Denticeps clupeoides TaxID=299321 RepID=A0AAY4A3H1_9TELE|nr:tetraspanin-1-like [Denticeps clupeoides]